MTHSDPNLLKALKFEIGRCECCGSTGILEVHHLWRRGIGGGARLDVRCFLAVLCVQFHPAIGCHDRTELPRGKNQITRLDLLRIVARRERTTPRAIECVHRWLDNLDKDASPERVERSMKLLSPGAVELAARVWAEIQASKAKRRPA
jgi:hypothetical protein